MKSFLAMDKQGPFLSLIKGIISQNPTLYIQEPGLRKGTQHMNQQDHFLEL